MSRHSIWPSELTISDIVNLCSKFGINDVHAIHAHALHAALLPDQTSKRRDPHEHDQQKNCGIPALTEMTVPKKEVFLALAALSGLNLENRNSWPGWMHRVTPMCCIEDEESDNDQPFFSDSQEEKIEAERQVPTESSAEMRNGSQEAIEPKRTVATVVATEQTEPLGLELPAKMTVPERLVEYRTMEAAMEVFDITSHAPEQAPEQAAVDSKPEPTIVGVKFNSRHEKWLKSAFSVMNVSQSGTLHFTYLPLLLLNLES